MVSESTVILSTDTLRLELSPSIGGAIVSFVWTGADTPRPILRQCNNTLENVLNAACFPLVPYVNRIRDGRFEFRGRLVELAPNMPGDPSPLHGQGWLGQWQVEEATDTGATISFHHSAGAWPWDYEAGQEFALNDRGLTLRLACRNISEEPMPCGLGQHPYFPCGPDTRLETQVTDAWTIDDKVLPVDKVPAEGRYELRDRLVCGQALDNGWGGWGGSARMSDPDWPYDLEISSPDARFFQLYSPETGGIFVAEPVSHANAALNAPEADWSELGMKVLEPGESMSLTMRLEVIAK